ncbi:MAG: lipoyl(octanoyl) transferase LipB [Bacillota bacterium]|nr:lipoyl(octanoyl) transferase LipB [Bacillota bacterium]
MKLNILDLGKLDYKETLDIQYKILDKVQNDECNDTLILVEHPPVITLGKNAVESNVLFSKEKLKEIGIDLYNIKRGGDVTYHGPGQLVGYPIFNLRKNHGQSIKLFIKKLEDVFIDFMKNEFELEVGRHSCNAGVWYGEEKLVALGLAVKKGVTMHGFAFNLNTILEHFDLIVPCGLSNMGVTSIEKIKGEKVDLEDVKEKIVKYFIEIYEFESIDSIEKR